VGLGGPLVVVGLVAVVNVAFVEVVGVIAVRQRGVPARRTMLGGCASWVT
jgi:hypothetical protein